MKIIFNNDNWINIEHMMTTQEAYQYLLDEEKGTKEKIISEIGEDLFKEFHLIGFIKEGMDGDWIQRWQLTEFGREQVSSYLEFYKMDKELDKICAELEISC